MQKFAPVTSEDQWDNQLTSFQLKMVVTLVCGRLYSLKSCYWVTKMSLRRWSAVAKWSFERRARLRGICITQDCSSESTYVIYYNDVQFHQNTFMQGS